MWRVPAGLVRAIYRSNGRISADMRAKRDAIIRADLASGVSVRQIVKHIRSELGVGTSYSTISKFAKSGGGSKPQDEETQKSEPETWELSVAEEDVEPEYSDESIADAIDDLGHEGDWDLSDEDIDAIFSAADEPEPEPEVEPEPEPEPPAPEPAPVADSPAETINLGRVKNQTFRKSDFRALHVDQSLIDHPDLGPYALLADQLIEANELSDIYVDELNMIAEGEYTKRESKEILSDIVDAFQGARQEDREAGRTPMELGQYREYEEDPDDPEDIALMQELEARQDMTLQEEYDSLVEEYHQRVERGEPVKELLEDIEETAWEIMFSSSSSEGSEGADVGEEDIQFTEEEMRMIREGDMRLYDLDYTGTDDEETSPRKKRQAPINPATGTPFEFEEDDYDPRQLARMDALLQAAESYAEQEGRRDTTAMGMALHDFLRDQSSSDVYEATPEDDYSDEDFDIGSGNISLADQPEPEYEEEEDDDEDFEEEVEQTVSFEDASPELVQAAVDRLRSLDYDVSQLEGLTHEELVDELGKMLKKAVG